jgi:hypothetical protein
MARREELQAALPSFGRDWDAAIDAGIDVSLLLENLDPSSTERLMALEGLVTEATALRGLAVPPGLGLLAASKDPYPAGSDASFRFRALLRALSNARLDFVVVGGVAATLHGVAEPTRDLDVCVRLEDDTWRKVSEVIAPLHPRFELIVDTRPIEATVEALRDLEHLYCLTDLGRIRFVGSIEPLGGFEAVLRNAPIVQVEELSLRVISRADLITVKEFVRRPKDLEVARALRAIADAERAR